MTKEEFQKQVKLTEHGGGCLNGYADVAYSTLIDLLGKPNVDGHDSKTDAEWAVEFEGETFAIYNYKTGKNYLGADGLDVEEIRDWHIGGRNKTKAKRLIALLESVK
jgi:hypothetical protein